MGRNNVENPHPQLSMDEELLTGVFDEFATPLYRYALRLCGDPVAADNVVGDAFAKLLDQVSLGQGPNGNTRSYLYQTTYHLIVDLGRENKNYAPLEATMYHPDNNTAGQAEERVMTELVYKAMQSELKDDQRNALILYYLEGFKEREVAEIMGITFNNVKVMLNRARNKLRDVLGVGTGI